MAQAVKESMLAGVVAENYAKALSDLAQESGQVDEIGQELAQLVELVHAQPDLAGLFAHKVIDPARRARTIETLFKDRVSPIVLSTLLVLNRKGRLEALPAIGAAYDRLAKEKRGEVDVDVYTAKPLSPAQAEKVAAGISRSLGKKAILQQHTDPKLIGGLKVRIGDKLIDSSIAARLRKLARDLEETGTDNVRAKMDRLLTA